MGLNPRRILLVAGLAVSAALGLVPAAAQAAPSRRIGPKPVVPAGAQSIGQLAQSTPLSVTVTLQPRDPAALAAYAAAVSTPGSADYHRYLSVSQFAQRFGPTASAIAAARESLRAQGLTPGPITANGLSLSVRASAGRLGSAFRTGFERYHLRSGRTAYANTSAPQVAGAAASVIQGVIGLSNLTVETPANVAPRRPVASLLSGFSHPNVTSTTADTACSSAASDSSAYGSYTAPQIATAYGFGGLYGAGDLGSGVTIALYELEPYSPSDISAYQSCYGTSASVSPVTVDGGAGSGAGQGEAALDIEDVVGLVPRATVQVYEGPNTNSGAYDTYQQIVTDDSAKVISTSWGLCESQAGSSQAQAENTLFQEAATQGQSIFAAAGDNGSQDCSNSGGPVGGQAVDDPASQPYVTGVGGTSLNSLSPSETVWNDGYPQGAGGGGVSTLWSMPSYQAGLARSQSLISCGSGGYVCREVPDVSADANENTGYDIYWNSRWTAIGGTSAAAPTWASLTALADASAACSSGPVGFANPALYAAARTGYGTYFNDVASGDNGYDGVAGYSAATGYDMASGLGTPKGTALAAAMCGVAGDSVTFRAAPGNQTSIAGRAVTPVSVAATSALSATPITYGATGLPPGLTIGTSSGEISGVPTRAGTYSVTVRAVDADGIAAARAFRWTISRPAVTLRSVGAQTATVGRIKRLALHASDSVGARLTYTTSGLPRGLSINHSTGVISGRPSSSGRRMVRVTATDLYGASATLQFAFVVHRRG